MSALGPGGETPIQGLEGVSIPAGGIITVSIPDDAGALDHPLVVLGDQPLLVQRLLPRNHNLEGRSASLAMPG